MTPGLTDCFWLPKPLTLLQDTGITKVLCHSLTADARFSCIFNDSTSLIDYESFLGDANCNINAPHTRPYEFSANGTALSRIAHAIQNSTTRSPLQFNNTTTPVFENGFQRLYGYYFDGPLYTEAIILNLDSISHTININSAIWSVSGGKYEQIYCGPGGPLEYIIGNPKSNPGANELAIASNVNATQTILLRPWSLTRIWKKKTAITVKATDTEICKGTTTTLLARGGSSYTWSGANVTYLKPDGSLVEFTTSNTSIKTYVVTVTDANGSTATATVRVFPKPTLTVTSTNTNLCKGNAVTLTAALTGGNSANISRYLWIPSDEINNPDHATCTAHPTKSTVFTVYATDGRCYTEFDTVAVTVGPKANAGDDKVVAVNKLPYTLTAQQIEAGVNYQWYQNKSLINNGYSALVSPANATEYALVAISTSNSACRDTDYVTITPVITCESATDTALTIPPYFTMKQFIARMTAYCAATGHGNITAESLSNFNQDIVFNGPFIVDDKFTFTNCSQLLFSDDAYFLQSENNQPLVFDNCTLKAAPCSGKMWRGLVVNEYGEKLTLKNCFIQDAVNGVEAINNAVITATNTQFDRCNTGIYLHDFTDDALGTITGCQFTGVKLILPPLYNRVRFAGVQCVDVPSVRIGDSTATTNFFEKSRFGVYAVNTTIEAYNNIFDHMKSTSTVANSGSGIYLSNSNGFGNINDEKQLWPEYTLSAGKPGINSINKFSNSPKGIVIENGDAFILGNNFNTVYNAITLNGCINKVIDINDNTILLTNTGIDLNDNKLASIDLYRNTITTNIANNTLNNRFCMRINDAAGFSSDLRIRDNILTNKGLHGIWVINNYDGIIQDNYIYMNQASNINSYGIKLENCEYFEVSCNLIRGNSTFTYTEKKALSLSYSPEADILCNTTDKTGTGMEFIADCNYSNLRNNTLQYHADGITIGADGLTGGIIGGQPFLGSFVRPNGNIFEGQYKLATGAGAKKGYFSHAATYSINSAAGGELGTINQFVVYEGDSLQVPFKNLKTGATSTALIPTYSSRVANSCKSGCDNPNPAKASALNPVAPADKFTLKEVMASRVDQLSDNAATVFSLKVNLLKRIDQRDLENNEPDKLKKFYLNSINANEGTLLNIQKNYRTIKNSSRLNPSITTQLLHENLKASESILPNTPFEENQKLIEQIKLNKMLKNQKDYSNEDMMVIKQIAEQCPYTGGTAVFEARSIYAIYNPEVYFNDMSICNGKSEADAHLPSGVPSVYFNVYPNPASGQVKLNYDLSDYSIILFDIYDLTGRLVLQYSLNSGSNYTTADLSYLENGMYNYSVKADDKIIKQGKITVIQ